MSGALGTTPSFKSSPPTAPATTAAATAPGSPSRTRSISTPAPSTPEILRTQAHKPTLQPPSEEEEGAKNPYAYESHTNGAPPSYDESKGEREEGEESEGTESESESASKGVPGESPRRYSMEEAHRSPRDPSSHREESPRRHRREILGDFDNLNLNLNLNVIHNTHSDQPDHATSATGHKRAVRHLLSRMSSLPSKEYIRITKEIDETLGAPASPRQTAARPPKVLKRNPSFWEVDAKKNKNQMTLRRYTDVGIVTVTLNVSGTVFATSTNTLLREPETLFATILEREEASIRGGKQIFLDRNPKYFGPILDYMRTGNFDRDAHIKYAKSIMIEAEFFKVKGLIKILHEVPELNRLQVLQIINGSDKPKLRGLWLPTVNLAGLDLTRANLDFSQMGRSNLRNVLLGGASICNASMVDVNLRNAVLSHATIAHTEFIRANISNATLRFVKCLRCDFTDADLSYCVFEGSDFQQCDFTGANLAGADFSSSDLSNSTFKNAIFTEETVFGNTITKGVEFGGSNVEVTKKKGGVFAMLGKKKKG